MLLIRSKQSAEWFTQAAHEGPVCRAVFDRASEAELPAALPAHVNGSSGLCPQWISDSSQPGQWGVPL